MTRKHDNNWDNRYDEARFFYGEEPNYFVKRELPGLPVGRGLFLAEGEGRNAVFAAGLGHDVVAVDNSFVGKRKALELAQRVGVEVEYRCEDLVAGKWDEEEWDFVVLCFAHLSPKVMAGVHERVAGCLRPGGRVILVSFAKSQFGRHSGGPPRVEWLHDVGELRGEFGGVKWERLEECEVELKESVGHFGAAMVVEGVGVIKTWG
jgi:SAM-dependent methyltransferase